MKMVKSVKLSGLLSESQIQAQICSYLNLKQVFFWRANTGAAKFGNAYVKFGKKGCADIIGILACVGIPNRNTCVCGRFLAIEVKTAKGKLSLDQQAFREAVVSNGGLFIEAHCLEDVTKVLEGKSS